MTIVLGYDDDLNFQNKHDNFGTTRNDLYCASCKIAVVLGEAQKLGASVNLEKLYQNLARLVCL